MNANVYHANLMPTGRMYDPHFDDSPNGYTLVALVYVPEGAAAIEACEMAFRDTNHIDRAWWDNPNVTRIGPKARSTSVGDIVVVNGQAYLVEGCGWSNTTLPETA